MSHSASALIHVKNATIGFQKPLLLVPELKLYPGEKVALVGVSGAGKSTLLRVLMGMMPPQKGIVNRYFRQWGWVFQSPHVIPWLSVKKNLQLVLPDEQQVTQQWETWAPVFGLSPDLWNKPAGYLSGGQKMRLNFLRALIKPHLEILFLDEPLQGVDPINRAQILDSMQTWAQQHPNLSWIWVTHHQDEFEPHSKAWVVVTAQTTPYTVVEQSTQGQTLVTILKGHL